MLCQRKDNHTIDSSYLTTFFSHKGKLLCTDSRAVTQETTSECVSNWSRKIVITRSWVNQQTVFLTTHICNHTETHRQTGRHSSSDNSRAQITFKQNFTHEKIHRHFFRLCCVRPPMQCYLCMKNILLKRLSG